MGPLKHVTITVTNGAVAADRNVVHVSKKGAEEVCWHSPQGEASINFTATPFGSDHFLVPRGGSLATGPASGVPGAYKYSIIVRIPGDRREYVIDPVVEVEE